MALRSALICILFLCSFPAIMQNTPKPKTQHKGTTFSYTGGDRDTCLDKEFSVVFYGFNDSANTRTPNSYAQFTSDLLTLWNDAFKRICVTFRNCSTVIIPNYEFNSWYYLKNDQAIIKDWYTENTINVYMPDLLELGPGHETGAYAYAPPLPSVPPPTPIGAHPSTLTVLVIETLALTNPPTFKEDAMHAVGHLLGLPDTFAETNIPASPTSTNVNVYTTEFSDGSNSAINGDRFQDTEADCFPGGLNLSPNAQTICSYGRNVTDGKGHYFNPPVDNYMSKWGCGCRFTQQQYNYMAWFITQHLIHLH